MNDEAFCVSGSFVLLSSSLPNASPASYLFLSEAYVFRAFVQPSAIKALLPCSNLLLACNYLSCFSYPFPKRLRHFFIFAVSQLSYVFSSHLFKIHHHNNPTCHHCLCHSNNLWAVTPRAAMETQALLKEFSGQLIAPHLQPGGTPPEAAITVSCFLSH